MTQARLLDGGPIAAYLRSQVKRGVGDFARRHGFRPALAAVKVGNQLASSVYVNRSCGPRQAVASRPRRRAAALDDRRRVARHDRGAQQRRHQVAGIIVQQPLPRHIPLTT